MNQLDTIKKRLQPLNEALPSIFPEARERALSSLEQIGTTRLQHKALYANNFLAAAQVVFQEDTMPDKWELTDGANCLHLRDTETGLTVRVLKEFEFTGDVPPAGNNQRRIKTWTQQPLTGFVMEPLFKAVKLEDVNLILTWKEIEAENKFLCVVRQPLEAGNFPEGAPSLTVLEMPFAISPSKYDELKYDGTKPRQRMVPRKNLVVTERADVGQEE